MADMSRHRPSSQRSGLDALVARRSSGGGKRGAVIQSQWPENWRARWLRLFGTEAASGDAGPRMAVRACSADCGRGAEDDRDTGYYEPPHKVGHHRPLTGWATRPDALAFRVRRPGQLVARPRDPTGGVMGSRGRIRGKRPDGQDSPAMGDGVRLRYRRSRRG